MDQVTIPENFTKLTAELMPVAIQIGTDVIAAIIILIVGFWIAGALQSVARRSLAKVERIDEMLAGFFASIVRYTIIAITLIAVLGQFGIETTSLVALIGAAGLAIGLALQGTLGNIAAGVMLLLFRPFKNGDYVEVAGHAGTVKHLGLFTTELATPDNVQIVIPNGDVWGSSLKNYSAHPTRRVDFVFGIGYGDNIDKAMSIILDAVRADKRILADPEPFLVCSNLGASSVDLTLRVWTASADYWAVKFDLTKAIKEAFDAGGIVIPYQTLTVEQVVV